MIILGITGYPSSGKDTVANYLVEKGFTHISTGDLIREEMMKKGIPLDRAHMQEFANEMRKVHGPGYLALEAIKRVFGNTIVSGLRNIFEVKVLREKFGDQYIMIALTAPIETRYEWATARKREGDVIPFELFKVEEEAEHHGRPDTQQVDDVIAMADYTIENTGVKEELLQKIDELVAWLGGHKE
ncbi:MAG: hypothetical protein UY07_C0017G0012 [Parcubacteria group bacterium GW2011_GWA1_47_8]|nr:hypothetical protein [uncultured bacterium]KKU81474.1 MAG: hypothetical protein UY07_C0017G0012 [Parcubacteria group bacterium GW2011_GWA1_47_8]